MNKLKISKRSASIAPNRGPVQAGCGRNWTEVCGTRN